jgi:hypothetical protein
MPRRQLDVAAATPVESLARPRQIQSYLHFFFRKSLGAAEHLPGDNLADPLLEWILPSERFRSARKRLWSEAVWPR